MDLVCHFDSNDDDPDHFLDYWTSRPLWRGAVATFLPVRRMELKVVLFLSIAACAG